MAREQDPEVAQVVACGASDDGVAQAMEEIVGVAAAHKIGDVETGGMCS